MTDLISRAKAIEEISKGVWNEYELIDRIEALPSAEPNCESCKHYEPKYDVCHAPELVKQVTSKLKSVEIPTDKGDKSTMSQPNGKLESADAVDVAHDIPEYCSWSQTYTNMVQSAMSKASADAVSREVKENDKLNTCNNHSNNADADYKPHIRLIDADALIFELEEWKKNPNNDDSAVDLVNHFIGIIRATPSAEQVAVKLNNPCDSLLTEESNGSKEHKSKLESADAVHGWRIGKPTEQGKYMVTLDSFGHKHIDLFYYGKPMMPNRKVRGKCWYRSDDEWGDVVYDDKDIIAWMPLPKPYECGARMKGGDSE